MPTTPAALGRLSAFVAGVLLLAVAAGLLVVVIPPVYEDAHPTATPTSAAIAFSVHAAIAAGVALVLLLAATGRLRRARWLVLAAVSSALLAFTLLDAANELTHHGPELRQATRVLRIGMAGELLAAALAAVTALTLRRPR